MRLIATGSADKQADLNGLATFFMAHVDVFFNPGPSQGQETNRNGHYILSRLKKNCGFAAATGDHGTSHLSVVDSKRNAVSFTTTINTSFGSKLLSQTTGTRIFSQ